MATPGRALVLLLSFLALSGHLGGVAEAASLGSRYAAANDGIVTATLVGLEPKPAGGAASFAPPAPAAGNRARATNLAKVGVQSAPATGAIVDTCASAACNQYAPCSAATTTQTVCTASDYTSSSSASTAVCRPGQTIDANIASQLIEVSGSTGPIFTRSTWSCSRHNYESACLDCRGKCLNTTNAMAGYVPVDDDTSGSAAAGTNVVCPDTSQTPAGGCPGASPLTANSPLGTSPASPFTSTMSSPLTTPFTPAMPATATATAVGGSPLNIGGTVCDSPLGCLTPTPTPVSVQRGCAPYCTDAVDAFRVTTTAPGRLSATEYTSCQGDKWKCTSYCSDCPAGTFDVMHAVGLDANCVNKADSVTCGTACGYIDGATGGMWCSAGIGLSSSPNACQIRGRHDCPAGFGPPDRTEEGAFSNHCSACEAGKFGKGGLTAAGTAHLATMGATGWTSSDMVLLFSHAETCQDCAAERVSARGSSECIDCAAKTELCTLVDTGVNVTGKWFASANKDRCECCPIGSAVDTTAHTCTVCPAGQIGNADGTCTACSGSNQFQDMAGQTECKTCSGVLTTTDGATTSMYCTNCNDNKYWPAGAGVTECAECPPGSMTSGGVTQSNGVKTSHTSCDLCPAGYTCSGYSTKMPCAPGTHASGTGNVGCTVCAAGTYADGLFVADGQQTAGIVACTACPVGKHNEHGTTDAGLHDDVSDCLTCPDGKFANSEGATMCATCKACPASEGKAVGTPCSATHDAICVCKSGWAGDGITCTKCTGNEYSPADNTATCLTCASGVGATARYTCPTFDATQTSCGATTGLTDDGACPGGSKYDVVDATSVSYYYLTATDWPPYKCSSTVTYDITSANFPGNAQCVADVCDGNFVEGTPSIWTTMEKTGTCATPTGKVCADGSTAQQCADADASSSITDFTCDVRCKVGYYSDPANALVTSATCRDGGLALVSGSVPASPMYQGPVSTQCLPGPCPANTVGNDVVSGCSPIGGYEGALTPTYEGPDGANKCLFGTCTHTVTQCQMGSASPEGQAECKPCEAGTNFASTVGALACTPCTVCTSSQKEEGGCTTTSDRTCHDKGICAASICTAERPLKGEKNILCADVTCTIDECCIAVVPTPAPTPTGGSSPDPACGTGCIVGIIVGSIIFIGICVCVFAAVKSGFFKKKKEKEETSDHGYKQKEEQGFEEEEAGQGWWDALFGSDQKPARSVGGKAPMSRHAATPAHDVEENDGDAQEDANGDAPADDAAADTADKNDDAEADHQVADDAEGADAEVEGGDEASAEEGEE